jgi:hypothetical protein
MPRTDDAAFQERERGLNAVRRNVAVNVNSVPMINSQMCRLRESSLDDSGRIGWPLVGHDYVNIFRDVFLDVLRQCARFHIFSMEETQFATALLDAHHNFLFVVLCALPMSSMLDSADEGLIHLDDAIQRLRIDFLHRRTNPVAEIPRRLVGNSQNALELIGAHPFLGLAKKVNAQEPLPQRQVRVIEDRSSSDGELIAACVAIKLAALYDLRDLYRFATWAHNRVGPAECFEVFAALVLGTKLLNKSAKINGVFHA